MTLLFILFSMILLTLAEFAFVISVKHPSAIAKILKLSRKSPTPKIIFGISVVIFVSFLYVFLKQLSSPQPNPIYFTQNQKDITRIPTTLNTDDYKQIGYDDFHTDEHYFFLYKTQDISPETLGKKASYIKSTVCKKPCTINFYDDVRAYIEDKERSSITSDKIMIEWNETNYVYVAEHYLGYLGSGQYASFTYYPYKDWYYNQQKSKENN